ncbi:MAG: DNA mismatch repair endonuclease MutL [Erysipelotrichaceae bacterium]
MSKIIKLDDHLRNLISAGEVVDRPSTIVKELVENSIDAKASRITVKITGGGLDSIKVIDNGLGMNKEEAVLAFYPFATSKIKKAADLNKISTLGFRGEALAAISSVSEVELITNDKDETTKIIYSFGKLQEQSISAREIGTSVSVSKLFYQTPNRLKFLKNVEYESYTIASLLQKFALSYPNIAFAYYKDDKEVFTSKGNNNIKELLFELYGKEAYSHFIEVEQADYDFKVSGFISDSHYSKSNKTGINIFLNQRLIGSQELQKTIIKAYGDYLADKRYPIVILNIESDPFLTDVNVTPTKWQIRISKEKALKNLIEKTITTALFEKSQPKLLTREPASNDSFNYASSLSENSNIQETSYQFFELDLANNYQRASAIDFPVVVGQALGKYILAYFNDEILIIDQHAAQERINYEKFKEELAKEKIITQSTFIEPITIESSKMQRLAEINDNLKTIGITLEAFGPNKVISREIPIWMNNIDVVQFIKDMIDYTLENNKIEITELRKHTLATLACHSSVRFNEHLNIFAQKIIVEDLFKCENPYHCPHGRPTIVKLSDKELIKEFNRV